MDAVERAVRAALEKGNAQDRAFRLKIYASAQAALERTLAARGADSLQLDARRNHLASVIKTVEIGYLAAADEAGAMVPGARHQAVAQGSIQFDIRQPAIANPAANMDASQAAAPAVTSEPRHQPASQPRAAAPAPVDPAGMTIPAYRSEPAFDMPAAPVQPAGATNTNDSFGALEAERRTAPRPAKLRTPKPDRADRGKMQWLRWGTNAALLLAIVLGGWWLYGEVMRQYELALKDGGKPQLSESGTSSLAEAEAELVEIFSPTDAPLITAPPGTEAKLGQRDGADTLTIRSTVAGTPVSIAVGQGVLQTFAGQRVLFNIKARAEGTSIVDTAVGCSFAGLGECERKRFRIAPEVAEYMFAVTLAAGSPSGDGVITFEPDVSGAGAGMQILAIRVSPVEGG